MVDGGAHQRDGLVAIPTSSPLPRYVDLDDRSIGQVVSPAQEQLADLGQQLLSAVALGSRWAVRQRNAQRQLR